MKPGRIVFAVLLFLALSVLLTAGYATAYVALGEHIDSRVAYFPEQPMDLMERNYSQAWLTHFFEPAAYAESRWIGRHVTLTYSETAGPSLVK